MTEFFTELLCEEIPARMQLKAAEDLKVAFNHHLTVQQLPFERLETYISPRRMVTVVYGLADATQAKVEERRGPKVGAPEAALQGFLRSMELTIEECEQRDGYWYGQKSIASRKAQDILPQVIQAILAEFNWPKSMRWAGSEQSWVRPLRSVLAMLNGSPLFFELPQWGLKSTDHTVGHRFLSPDPILVTGFADYQQKLKDAYVILDHQERQKLIRDGLEALGCKKGYSLEQDDKLLEEVAGLVEYPQPLIGTIDEAFMRLPKSVLSTSMRVHQKYFTFVDSSGAIAPIFGFAANTIPSDGGTQMLVGYERVLRARLSDARFFFEQDQKTPMAQASDKLASIVFHADLGTLAQKVTRLQNLVASETSKKAAQLCKADLVSQMVGEFPELQGIMGDIYAQLEGYPKEVAQAIREHYLPQGPQDGLPQTPAGIELAIAERVDTLVGFFAIGAEPTGSKDPYALRRMALGLIRIIREQGIKDFDLKRLIEKAYDLYVQQGIKIQPGFSLDSVYQFISERLEHTLKGENIRLDAIRAVMKAQPQTFNLWSIAERATALSALLKTPAGAALQEAFRRAHGILAGVSDLGVMPERFVSESETQLYQHLRTIAEVAPQLLKSHHYHQLMAQLADIKQPLDQFFELKINDDDPIIRQNRLALVQDLVRQTLIIADLSQLEGL